MLLVRNLVPIAVGFAFGNAQNMTTFDETRMAQSSLGVGLEEVAVFSQCLKLLGPFTISLFDQIQIGLTKSSIIFYYFLGLITTMVWIGFSFSSLVANWHGLRG